MPCCISTIIYPPIIRRLSRWLNSNRRHSPIHILNNDVLLNIFHQYRLAEPDEYEDENGFWNFEWDRQRSNWWYKLAHVCRLWRNLILESPSGLDLHLFCTNGVPVADMLTHSPLLPLTICYDTVNREITAEDESGILLALSSSHRDRVHRICFWMLPNVGKFVTVMDDQFPILERMYIQSRTEVVLPVTFQASNLRHLRLWTASIPIGSPIITTTAVGLVTLVLEDIPASAYFPPSYILNHLSVMVQLERMGIAFKSAHPNHEVETQLNQTPSISQVTLPKLHRFLFRGTATYLEGLVARISAPFLSTCHLGLFNQFFLAVPGLLQFIKASENLRFTAVQVAFHALDVSIHGVTRGWDTPLTLRIRCGDLDWQFASAVQFFDTLSPILSIVEQVTFSYEEHDQSSEWHNTINRRQWRELLGLFTSAKTIRVQDNLVSKIFRSLPSVGGEPPLELLPNLEEVGYSRGSDAWDTIVFRAFLKERQKADHPVSLRLVDRSMFYEPNVHYV